MNDKLKYLDVRMNKCMGRMLYLANMIHTYRRRNANRDISSPIVILEGNRFLDNKKIKLFKNIDLIEGSDSD